MGRPSSPVLRGCFILGVIVVASCGASRASVRTASSAEYRVTRDVLWSEILGAMRSRYPKLEVAELGATKLVTRWMATGRRVPADGPVRGKISYVPYVERVTVVVVGRNPYRVAVDVEAALPLTEEPPKPFLHGEFTEPLWVTDDRDALVLAIHGRLSPYVNAH